MHFFGSIFFFPKTENIARLDKVKYMQGNLNEEIALFLITLDSKIQNIYVYRKVSGICTWNEITYEDVSCEYIEPYVIQIFFSNDMLFYDYVLAYYPRSVLKMFQTSTH